MPTGRTTSLLRFLDRAIGIPALVPFALTHKRRAPDPGSVRHVGVFKSAAIGDTLLLVGVFEALRARFPQARISLITGPDNAAVAPYFASVVDNHVVVSPRNPLAAARVLRKIELDVLLECGPWPRVDAFIAAYSGAGYRVGFRVRGQARHYAFDRVVLHSSALHQLENFRNLARAVGATEFAPPRLSPPNTPAPPLPSEPYVVFHPWSGGYMGHAKEWPSARWVELGLQLHESFAPRLVITGGAGDRTRSSSLAAQLTDVGLRAESMAGRLSLGELGHVLARSEAVAAVNTGVMHLAALLGARTVSLDGPTPPSRWGPIGPRARSVSSSFPGCGYLNLGFEYAGQRLDCMDGVSVQAVALAVEELRGSA